LANKLLLLFNIILHRIYTLSLNTHISSPFVKRNYSSSTCLSHEKTSEETKEDEGVARGGRRWCRRTRQKEKEGGGGSRERGKWKMHFFFFFVIGAHARAIVCLRVISFPNLFYPMEIRHPSECICMCVYSWSVLHLYVYRGIPSNCVMSVYLCVCVCVCCMYTRVNILCFER
jgi:hypothetical protein